MSALTNGSANINRQAAMGGRRKDKRKVDLVDLTGSDDERAGGPQARKFPRTDEQPATFSQPQRDQLVDELDEVDANEVINLSQDGSGSASDTYELYGMHHSIRAHCEQ